MKKTHLILAAAALCVGAFASNASAVTTIISSTNIGGGIYSPSAKVGIHVVSAPTSYGAQSAHLNGSLQYGTGGGTNYTMDPAKILSKAIPTQAATNTVGVPDDPTATALSGTATDWK